MTSFPELGPVVAAREEKYSILRVKTEPLGRLQTRHLPSAIFVARPDGPGALRGWRRIDQQGTCGGAFCHEGYPCQTH